MDDWYAWGDMKNVGGKSEYIAFVDECGDHTLDLIDKDFPLFLLATVVVRRADYAERIIPALAQFKLKYWVHEGVNLHSRDIRKAKGPFGFLQVPALRTSFMEALSSLIRELPYALFISAIRKDKHKARSGTDAANPYDLALESTLEQIIHFIEGKGLGEIPFVAEARGRKEDNTLERCFYRMMSEGTAHVDGNRFKSLNCPLVFRNKFDNIAGIQLADLCAHPCARHILQPEHTSRAFEIVNEKIYRDDSGAAWQISP